MVLLQNNEDQCLMNAVRAVCPCKSFVLHFPPKCVATLPAQHISLIRFIFACVLGTPCTMIVQLIATMFPMYWMHVLDIECQQCGPCLLHILKVSKQEVQPFQMCPLNSPGRPAPPGLHPPPPTHPWCPVITDPPSAPTQSHSHGPPKALDSRAQGLSEGSRPEVKPPASS